MPFHLSHRGRGTTQSPPNRFEQNTVFSDDGAWEEISRIDPDFEPARPRTESLEDDSQSIITSNSSPDIGFSHSLNPYRGCEHGCSYCYARPYHEYLGMNAGIDFETRIMVKSSAPRLLEETLAKPSWKPVSLACSGVTDCYQPIEKKLEITRHCLEVLADFRNPVGIITKNALVTRDMDVLSRLAAHDASLVVISITSLDADLAGQLEPRASRPAARLEAIRQLSEAGIPVGVSVAPIIPGLNDHEAPAIVEAAAEAGAEFVGYSVVRLPGTVAEVFEGWLAEHESEETAGKVLKGIRRMRDGRLNTSDYTGRMKGEGEAADRMRTMFRVLRKKYGLAGRRPELSNAAFRRVAADQPELF